MAHSKHMYTLIQHTGYTQGRNKSFQHAVEEAWVSSQGLFDKITDAGGVLFDSYLVADMAAYRVNYPPGCEGLIPQAKGSFINVKYSSVRHRIYIPTLVERNAFAELTKESRYARVL